MRLIAKARVYYPSGGGKEYQPGEAFETQTDKDAEALVLVGMAEYIPKPSTAKKTLTLKPAAPVETISDKVEAKAVKSTADTKDLMTATGAYRRRDMRPEE